MITSLDAHDRKRRKNGPAEAGARAAVFSLYRKAAASFLSPRLSDRRGIASLIEKLIAGLDQPAGRSIAIGWNCLRNLIISADH